MAVHEYFLTVGAGLLILLVLLLAFNLQPAQAPARQPVIAGSLFDFGAFNAAFVKQTRVHDLGSKELSNGLLFGESKIAYHFEAPEIESAVIRFRVARTNDLGPMLVRANGRTVEAKNYAVGDYTVTVPKELLNESMTVELAAQSSLWQFWAPNIYVVRNANIVSRSFSFEPAELNFTLSEEFSSFKEGRVEFSLEQNTGRFAVVLNDNEIFSDFARSEQSMPFRKEHVKAGENKLRIVPSQGSRLAGLARVVVFFEK